MFRSRVYDSVLSCPTIPVDHSLILVGNQLDAQFLLWYVYLNPLHVSSNYVIILRRTIVLTPILLTRRIWRAPNNASKWQMGFNLVFNLLKPTGHVMHKPV